MDPDLLAGFSPAGECVGQTRLGRGDEDLQGEKRKKENKSAEKREERELGERGVWQSSRAFGPRVACGVWWGDQAACWGRRRLESGPRGRRQTWPWRWVLGRTPSPCPFPAPALGSTLGDAHGYFSGPASRRGWVRAGERPRKSPGRRLGSRALHSLPVLCGGLGPRPACPPAPPPSVLCLSFLISQLGMKSQRE